MILLWSPPSGGYVGIDSGDKAAMGTFPTILLVLSEEEDTEGLHNE